MYVLRHTVRRNQQSGRVHALLGADGCKAIHLQFRPKIRLSIPFKSLICGLIRLYSSVKNLFAIVIAPALVSMRRGLH